MIPGFQGTSPVFKVQFRVFKVQFRFFKVQFRFFKVQFRVFKVQFRFFKNRGKFEPGNGEVFYEIKRKSPCVFQHIKCRLVILSALKDLVRHNIVERHIAQEASESAALAVVEREKAAPALAPSVSPFLNSCGGKIR